MVTEVWLNSEKCFRTEYYTVKTPTVSAAEILVPNQERNRFLIHILTHDTPWIKCFIN